jgi:hypothetical protein
MNIYFLFGVYCVFKKGAGPPWDLKTWGKLYENFKVYVNICAGVKVALLDIVSTLDPQLSC